MFDLPAGLKLLGQLGAATIPVVGGVYPANLAFRSSAASSWGGSPTR